MLTDPLLFPNSSKGMLHMWAFGRARVCTVSARSQTAARQSETVLHYVQHTGKIFQNLLGLFLQYPTVQTCSIKCSTFLAGAHPSLTTGSLSQSSHSTRRCSLSQFCAQTHDEAVCCALHSN